MFQFKPRTTEKEAQSASPASNVIRQIVHSAGVVVGSIIVSALIVSQEGRTLGHN